MKGIQAAEAEASSAQLSLPQILPPVALPAAGLLPAAVPVQASAQEPAKPLTPMPKKPLFWSAALIPPMEAEKDQPAQADRSNVPAVLRNLRKCQACGFPVSVGRVLCVECEEKKFRGKLRIPGSEASAKLPNDAPAVLATTGTVEVTRVGTPTALIPLPEQRSLAPSYSLTGGGPELVLSAGLAPSESWFSANKYVLIFVAIVVALAAAVAFLH
jgi:hypothetical protein